MRTIHWTKIKLAKHNNETEKWNLWTITFHTFWSFEWCLYLCVQILQRFLHFLLWLLTTTARHDSVWCHVIIACWKRMFGFISRPTLYHCHFEQKPSLVLPFARAFVLFSDKKSMIIGFHIRLTSMFVLWLYSQFFSPSLILLILVNFRPESNMYHNLRTNNETNQYYLVGARDIHFHILYCLSL